MSKFFGDAQTAKAAMNDDVFRLKKPVSTVASHISPAYIDYKFEAPPSGASFGE